MTSEQMAGEIDRLWSGAQARQDAGEPTLRYTPIAYSMAPGDSEISPRAWLTEFEADRLHSLGLTIGPAMREEASQRIKLKRSQHAR